MIDVTLEPYEIALAADVGVRRQLAALEAHLPDAFGFAGAGWSEHVEGAGGELAFAKATKRYWNGSVNTFKNGDVGTVQVRTRRDPKYDLLVRPGDSDDDAFVLVIGTIPKFCVVGWLYGREAKQEKWLRTYGNRPAAYFVPQAALRVVKGAIIG
jgi:hypothetical protein